MVAGSMPELKVEQVRMRVLAAEISAYDLMLR